VLGGDLAEHGFLQVDAGGRGFLPLLNLPAFSGDEILGLEFLALGDQEVRHRAKTHRQNGFEPLPASRIVDAFQLIERAELRQLRPRQIIQNVVGRLAQPPGRFGQPESKQPLRPENQFFAAASIVILSPQILRITLASGAITSLSNSRSHSRSASVNSGC
jgi:hypothetical protein